MFGSKTRTIRDLQQRLADQGERLQEARDDVETWRRNYGRLQLANEALETANATLKSMMGAQRTQGPSTAEPTPASASTDQPVERDLTGARIRPEGQPLDLADELQRARAHAADLEQRLAGLQAANESAYAELAARAGTAPAPLAGDKVEAVASA